MKLLGIGQSLPSKIMSNEDVQSITGGSSAEWIERKLGIQERRIAVGETVVTLGAAAAREAILDSGLAPNDIDLIIVNTSSADNVSPSVACMVQEKLGLNCPAFDVNAVCTGFLYALELSSLMFQKYTNVLIISTETYSKITNWEHRNSCFFGDGAAAVVVSDGDNDFYSSIGADGTGSMHFRCDRRSTFHMDGKEVYKFGVRVLPAEIGKLITNNGIELGDVDWVVPHQPSHNVLKDTADTLGIAQDKIYFNMKRFANTAGASVPMALYDGIKSGKIKSGNNLILAAIGSGWTYGVCFLRLNYK